MYSFRLALRRVCCAVLKEPRGACTRFTWIPCAQYLRVYVLSLYLRGACLALSMNSHLRSCECGEDRRLSLARTHHVQLFNATLRCAATSVANADQHPPHPVRKSSEPAVNAIPAAAARAGARATAKSNPFRLRSAGGSVRPILLACPPPAARRLSVRHGRSGAFFRRAMGFRPRWRRDAGVIR